MSFCLWTLVDVIEHQLDHIPGTCCLHIGIISYYLVNLEKYLCSTSNDTRSYQAEI